MDGLYANRSANRRHCAVPMGHETIMTESSSPAPSKAMRVLLATVLSL